MTNENGDDAETILRQFIQQQKDWLELEWKTSEPEPKDAHSSSSSSPTSKSSVVQRLEVSAVHVGLYGRTVIQLTAYTPTNATATATTTGASSSSSGTLLPAHRLTVGDAVELHSSPSPPGPPPPSEERHNHKTKKKKQKHQGGVISAVTDYSISVALYQTKTKTASTTTTSKKNNNKNKNKKNKDTNNVHDADDHDDEDSTFVGIPPFTLIPKSNIEVHRKLLSTLAELEQHGRNHPIAGHLIRALFPTTTTTAATTASSLLSSSKSSSNHPDQDKHRPAQQEKNTTTTMERFNTQLDDSQWDAIQFALAGGGNDAHQSALPVALIHGPPGTGKTTTVAELIQQAVYHYGLRVLVCAPSNVAVDNIVERLVAATAINTGTGRPTKNGHTKNKSKNNKKNKKKPSPLRMVRLGHPARIQPSVVHYSLEALVQQAEGTDIVQDVKQELTQYLHVLTSNPTTTRHNYHAKRTAYREVKLLRQEVRYREETIVRQLLQKAQVVLATTVGAASRLLRTTTKDEQSADNGFDLVIIDEAAQALEVACWIPILQCRGKLVLAGDHCQLPPTIMSKQSHVVQGLGRTLFQRLMEVYGDTPPPPTMNNHQYNHNSRQEGGGRISRMLRVQYRMHQNIANWASTVMYHNNLVTHHSVATRTLSQLVQKSNCDEQQQSLEDKDDDNDDDDDEDSTTAAAVTEADMALLLIDTAGCDMYESETASGSKLNRGEADCVAKHVIDTLLTTVGIREEQIAIITPYSGQVELLKSMLLPTHPKLEIRTVDGFQGGEREAVVLSLVRSNSNGRARNIGFLSDDRRLNVAVTRAKRHCAVICDSDTVSVSTFVTSLITWIEQYGEQRSAIEFLQDAGETSISTKDMRDAELEIRKQMAILEREQQQQAKANKGKGNSNNNNNNRTDDATTRKALLDKISAFSETGTTGQELVLSTKLTSFDRRVVHDFSEQIGLDHRSEGIQGEDRKIILAIKKQQLHTPSALSDSGTINPVSRLTGEGNDEVSSDEAFLDAPLVSATTTLFGALVIDDSDSESDNSDKKVDDENQDAVSTTCISRKPANQLLGELAKERAQRAQKQQEVRQQSSSNNSAGTVKNTKKKNKKKKSKGHKSGGGKVAAKILEKEEDDGNMDDDFAFLDKQIEKVQTSHGRNVVGTGSNYRTVINGILLSKPGPREEQKDTKVAAALQAKLKKAQGDRKAKPKKKKKR